MRTFDTWLSQFRDSISSYDYYIDFARVVENAKQWKTELHMLNSLIGAADIETEFRALYEKYPQILKAIPILLAKRESEIYARDEQGGGLYRFDTPTQTLDEYCVFMRKTGLFGLISKHLINNLYDYVVGVETGLNANARKNRGGHQMEDLVEGFLRRAGIDCHKEVTTKELATKFGIDLPTLTNAGKTIKRFDFVVKTANCLYAIETNFYASSGSKLNETARSYKMLALEAKNVPNFKFVWITDGLGWQSARQNLRETFDVLPTIYNIKELEDGIAKTLFV